MATLLVQGGAGFVGRHLVSSPAFPGYDRLVVVDPAVTSPGACGLPDGRELIRVRSEYLGEFGEPVDAVVCVAGATSVDAALQEPASAHLTNLKVTLDFCEFLRRNRGLHGVYMSSDEVLGASDVPLAEDAPMAPTQPYAASKAAAELILHNYSSTYGIAVAIVRSCNLVGPDQQLPKLIPSVVKHMMMGLPVPVHGTGRQRREFMDVSDMLSAIALLLRRGACGVFQAASGFHASVLEVVDEIGSDLQLPYSVQHVQDRLVQDSNYAMQTSRLEELGWRVRVAPQAAIRSAANALRIRLENSGGVG